MKKLSVPSAKPSSSASKLSVAVALPGANITNGVAGVTKSAGLVMLGGLPLIE